MKLFEVVKIRKVVSYAFIEAESFADAEEIAEMYPEQFEFDHEVDEYTGRVAE